jgi:hypothetical protein
MKKQKNCGRCGVPLGDGSMTVIGGTNICPRCAAEMYKPQLPLGWLCPKCGKINNPKKEQCNCK